jgi:hypothetical protein
MSKRTDEMSVEELLAKHHNWARRTVDVFVVMLLAIAIAAGLMWRMHQSDVKAKQWSRCFVEQGYDASTC